MNLDLTTILPAIGYIGIFAMVFAESGLLLGFFLPGDSLLFTAGFLASQNIFNIIPLALGCFIAAVLGDQVGYATGNKFGKKLFQKENSILFHKHYLVKANEFYKKHGKKTIVIARFLPAVRTFAPIVAGVGDMHYRTFVTFNVIGGFLWAIGVTTAGYFLGSAIPNVDKYLLPIIGAIIFISVVPTAIHILKEENSRRSLVLLVKKALSSLLAPFRPPKHL